MKMKIIIFRCVFGAKNSVEGIGGFAFLRSGRLMIVLSVVKIECFYRVVLQGFMCVLEAFVK
ncbi:hypothetical protein BKM32_03005 [Mangrovimonas sp. DI 80]|nr:hypothetical protein BKM32_03005 [Mangrovimonas sp. DI 80]